MNLPQRSSQPSPVFVPVCAECGATEFEKGEIAPGGGHPHVNFYPDGSIFGSDGKRVRARRCIQCGLLTFHAKPE